MRLREQVTAQQNQLEEYRREKIDLDVALGEADVAALHAASR